MKRKILAGLPLVAAVSILLAPASKSGQAAFNFAPSTGWDNFIDWIA